MEKDQGLKTSQKKSISPFLLTENDLRGIHLEVWRPENSRLLIVDDNPSDLLLFKKIMKNEGYKVKAISNGLEAWKWLQKNPVDLIMLDVIMPEIGGIELCRKIKGDRLLHDIPVIMVTSKDDPYSLEEGFEAGAIDYVTKPIQKVVLRARVKSGLKIKHYQDQLKLVCQELLKKQGELKRLLAYDRLTGLYNRYFFLERMEEEIEMAKRFGMPLSLAMLDIDHFKKVNDHYGHLFGDYVLQEIGKMMLMHFRKTDMIARYGGEEFTILATGSYKDGLAHACERFRKKVEKYKFSSEDIEITLTISIGVADFIPSKDDDGIDLIRRADTALYEAKGRGRNRVVVSSSSASPS